MPKTLTNYQHTPYDIKGLVVTVDNALETHSYLTIVGNVIDMTRFINANNKFNVSVYRNNASNIPFHIKVTLNCNN